MSRRDPLPETSAFERFTTGDRIQQILWIKSGLRIAGFS